MVSTRGVLFQTIPEEVAQAVDYLSRHYQLPSEVVIKAGVSMLVAMTQQGDPRVVRFMDAVRADFDRSLDRVLA